MFTKEFWKDAVERVISTAAQAAAGVLVADSITGLATKEGAIVVGTAAALALLKSLIANAVTSDEDTVSPASFAPSGH